MPPKSNVQVDLIANPEGLDEELAQSEKNLTAYGNKIQTILDKIAAGFKQLGTIPSRVLDGIRTGLEKIISTLANVSKSTLQLAYNFGILKNQYQGASDVLDNYIRVLNQSWERQSDLTLAIRLSGNAAGYTATQMRQYAEYLEKVTRFERDATEGAEQILTKFRDIRGKQFLDATKAAQDLAQALKIDLVSATSLVGSSLQNPIESFQQLENIGVRFTEQEKKMVLSLLQTNKVVEAQRMVLDKLNNAFGGAAKAAGDTFAGTLDRVRNRLTTVATTIGSYLVNALEKLTKTANTGVSTIEAYMQKIESMVPVVTKLIDEWIPKIQELAATIKDRLVVGLNFMAQQTIRAFLIAQEAYNNFYRVQAVISDSVKLSLEKVSSMMRHTWNEVLPKTLNYAGDVLSKFAELLRIEFWSVFRSVQYNLDVFGHNFVASFLQMKDKAEHTIVNFIMGLPLKIIKLNVELPMLIGKLGINMGAALINGLIKSLGPAAKLLAFFGITLPGKIAGTIGVGAMSGLEAYFQGKIDEFNKLFEIQQKKTDDSRIKHKYKAIFGEADVDKQVKDLMDALKTGPKINEREKTEKELALEADISTQLDALNKAMQGTEGASKEMLDALKTKLQKLLEESEKANKAFLDEFGHAPSEPGLGSKSDAKYNRQEAIDKQLLDAKRKETEMVNNNARRSSGGTVDLLGVEEAINSLNNQNPVDANTKAIKENTAAINKKSEIEKRFDTQKALAEHRKAFDERFGKKRLADDAKPDKPRFAPRKPLSDEEFAKKLERAEAARIAIREVRSKKNVESEESKRFKEFAEGLRQRRLESLEKRAKEKSMADKANADDKNLKEVASNTWDLLQVMKKRFDEPNTLLSVGVAG